MVASIDLFARKSCPQNHLTHTLTHNGIVFSGQGSTKQHPTAAKLKKLGIFKTFFKPIGSIICVHKPGFLKRNRLPTEANETLLLWAVCVPGGVSLVYLSCWMLFPDFIAASEIPEKTAATYVAAISSANS